LVGIVLLTPLVSIRGIEVSRDPLRKLSDIKTFKTFKITTPSTEIHKG
jgi:hypothetical protein